MNVARTALIGVTFSSFLMANVAQPWAQTNNPNSTAVPIIFTHSVDASKVHTGTEVTAKTPQIVFLPSGREIPKGTIVLGHVTSARPFLFDPTPYAVQQPSVLSIRFDKVIEKNVVLNVLASVRVLAGWSDSEDAMQPQRTDELDTVGTMWLIGGDSYRANEKSVTTQEGDIVGYNRKDGVFARLLDSEYTSRYSHFECRGSGESEQSVAIFAPSACGLYGMPDTYLADNGLGKELGTFRLESRRQTVKLYAQSTALLQIISMP